MELSSASEVSSQWCSFLKHRPCFPALLPQQMLSKFYGIIDVCLMPWFGLPQSTRSCFPDNPGGAGKGTDCELSVSWACQWLWSQWQQGGVADKMLGGGVVVQRWNCAGWGLSVLGQALSQMWMSPAGVGSGRSTWRDGHWWVQGAGCPWWLLLRCLQAFGGADQVTGVSCTITGTSQAEPMQQQPRLAMFALEAIVLTSILGRGKEKATGEVAASLLLFPSFKS